MHIRKLWGAMFIFVACCCASLTRAQTKSGLSQADSASLGFSTGWKLIKEGAAEGTIEQDAKHPQRSSPHLLRMTVTKTAEPDKGRAGAINATPIDVAADRWYDITFSAVAEKGSVGLVFSLESNDGKVLARTTLPEIGRGEHDGADSSPPDAKADAASSPWRNYSVSLHARAANSQAHLVITPIEPTSVWLDDLKLTPRALSPAK
ncbi:MAG TPA: hypothetical protein VFE46_17210 [Pirellulales bacterium]|jgi:hypothetical protein|nr:hypothetical protein [Pirellulales bacterium]